MYDPFTPPWAGALREALNASERYRDAARRWSWRTALVMDADPARGIHSDTAVVLDLERGSCRSAEIMPAGVADAEFVLRGDYAAWREIVEGALDPMTALLRNRLRLEQGSLARLALHASAARALAACAAEVPTRFVHDAIVAPEAASADDGADASALAAGADAGTETGSLSGHAVTGATSDEDVADPAASGSPLGAPEPWDPDAYLQLFHNAGRLAWEAGAIDLSVDRDEWPEIREKYRRERYGEQIHRLCSLFFEGEESVTRTLSPFLGAVARAGLGIEKELHLSAQIYEEARHYAFFRRYFDEVLGDDDTGRHMAQAPQAVLVDDLDDVADRIRHEDDPERLRDLLVEGVTHYMGIVEAMLARTGYRGVGQALGQRGWLPGLQEGFRLIRRDEGRHVAFGIHFIGELTRDDPARAEIVRRTFERHLPAVLQTVAAFDFEHPLVDVADLQEYALGAYRQFMAAAGLDEDVGGELERELAGA
jgi:ribonucleoside-diphosphate reductase beta chain